MKKAITIIPALFLCISLLAQTGGSYTFSYDYAGNCTARIYSTPPSLRDSSSFSGTDSSNITATPNWTSLDAILGGVSQNVESETACETEEALNRYAKEWEAAMLTLLEKKGAANPDRSSYSVGEIPCQSGVSPSGARTFSVPIPVAPGLKMAPSLALGYNSQAGDGWAGFGWTIQGISTISLVNRNLYYHGEAMAADVFRADNAVFALDGVPLVTNTNTANNAEFPLVTATGHIFVKRSNNAFGWPATFTALFPDGSVCTYGVSTQYYDAHNYYPSYPIVERVDNLGNICTYLYFAYISNGHYYPQVIRYGYQSGGNYQGEIVFNYQDRSDYVSHYYAGAPIYTDKLLTSVVSKSGNETLCTYTLTHTTTDNTELLTQIDCSSGSENLAPLSFTYGDPTLPDSGQLRKSDNSVDLSTWISSDNYETHRGKLMNNNYGDGLIAYLDLPVYTVTLCHIQPAPQAFLYEYGSNYPANAKLFVLTRNSSGGYNSVDNSISAGVGFQTAEVVDVDGDGVDEIVKANFVGVNGNKTILRLTTYKCDSSGSPIQQFSNTVSINGTVTSGTYISPARREYYWGDFRCNGKTQLLTICTNNTGCGDNPAQTCYAALIDLNNLSLISDTVIFDLPVLNAQRNTFAIDLDNDGKTELCHATSQGLDVYSTGAGPVFSLEATHGNITSDLLSSVTAPVLNFADLNGDGLVDIVAPPFMDGSNSTSYYWDIYYYTGHSFQHEVVPFAYRHSGEKFFLIDVNYDGMADLIKISGTTFGVYLNQNGISFGSFQQSPDTITSDNHIVPVNGMEYNRASCFIVLDGATIQDYSYTRPAPLVRRVATLTDSFGRLLTSIYAYLPDVAPSWTDASYTPSTTDGYAVKPMPVYVLRQEKAYQTGSMTGCYRYNTYEYLNMVLHSKGLGFCGFSKIRARDASRYPHYCTTTSYNPEKLGVITREQTALQYFGALPFQSINYTYDNHSTTYGKLSPRLVESTAVDALTGITTTTEYGNYNNYDFPQIILTSRTDGNGSCHTQLIHRTYQNVVSSTHSILGLLTDERIWHETSSSQTGAWGERNVFCYYSATHLLESQSHYVGQVSSGVAVSNLESTREWTYDGYGNVLSDKSSPYNVTSMLGTSYTYDNNGRFITSSTDALGHTTTYSGYNKHGKPSSITDYQGRTISVSYDAWGNPLSKTYADGTVETTSAIWGGNGLYRISRTRTGAMPERKDFDFLGRETHRGLQRYNGSWLQEDRLYDSEGHLWKVSLPYKTSGSIYWNVYSYDSYNRPTSYVEASGRSTTYSYNGLDITTVQDGITSTRTMDVSGRTVSVTDNGGTIVYSLRDDGQPLSVTAPGNVVTSFSYDAFGRRTQLLDPSAGIQSDSWVWNSDGSSTHTHTNANGSVTIGRDSFGRTAFISRPSDYTTYSYDSYDRLTQINTSNGSSTTYTYDSYDRVYILQQNVDSVYLKRTFTYGVGSVISAINYTTQEGDLATENYSYSNGQLIRIKLGNSQDIWNLSSENELGLTTQFSCFGLTHQHGYDAYGYPTSRIIRGEGRPIQHFTYNFNPATGNLTSRTDEKRHITETFTYDNLNRLSTAGTNQVIYDGKGNISSISQVGSMYYSNNSAPYQITGLAAGNGTSLRHRSQTITYTAFDRPETISEGDTTATFIYDAEGKRVKMIISVNGVVKSRRYYIGDRYQLDVIGRARQEWLSLGGNYYSSLAFKGRRNNGLLSIGQFGRDYQGSVTHILSLNLLMSEYSYDPWGRLRDPATHVVYTPGTEPTPHASRGFTGHEHLSDFGLINMNARLYDPLIGRFLSPDPIIQAPDFTQNFNRYTYALNNPLKYVDRDGEEFTIGALLIVAGITAAVFGASNLAAHAVRNDNLGNGNWAKYFFSGALSGFLVGASMYGGLWGAGILGGMSEVVGIIGDVAYEFASIAAGMTSISAIGGTVFKGSEGLANMGKIFLGNFYLDERKSFWGQVWEGVSRYSWEIVQTGLGYVVSQARNAVSLVDRVDYYGGATIAISQNRNSHQGFTLGSFINFDVKGKIPSSVSFDDYIMKNDQYLAHEYGHIIQSRCFGPLYTIMGVLSLGSATSDFVFGTGHNHDSYFTEVMANRFASSIFKSYVWGTDTFPTSYSF